MTRVFRCLGVCLAVLSGCALEFRVPSDAELVCATNDDCLEGSLCDTAVGRCIAANTPVVRVLGPEPSAQRYTRQVPFSIELVSADSQEMFDVRVELAVMNGDDALVWESVPVVEGAAALTGLSGSTSGTRYSFVWDALESVAYGEVLDVARVDLEGDGDSADPIVRTATVVLRATAANAKGVTSPTAMSTPFVVGNTAPKASIDSVIGSSGVITVVVGLTDGTSDTCGFELQFLGPDGAWRNAALAFGGTETLGCPAETPLQAAVGWDSLATYFELSEEPATRPQGIGAVTLPGPNDSIRIQLRARAYDTVEATSVEQHWGAWSAPFSLPQVTNQTSPQILELAAPRTIGVGGTSPIHVKYRLADAQSDAVDVAIEYSTDAGSSWTACEEYPYLFSEGTAQLITAPLSGDGTGGVWHLFTWDPSSLSAKVHGSTLLRVTADDAKSSATTLEASLASPASTTGDAPHDALLRTVLSAPLHDANNTTETCCITGAASADFNGDGLNDLALAKPTSNTISILLNDGSFTSPWNETHLAATDLRSLAAGNFATNGHAALVGVDSLGTARVWRGNGSGGFTLDTSFSVDAARQLFVADVNNDGRDDLVVHRDSFSPPYRVRVYLNTGVSGDLFENPSYTEERDNSFSLAVGDADADGTVDLVLTSGGDDGAVLRGAGDGTFENIATFSGQVSNGGNTLDIGDVNGDAMPDLLLANGYSRTYLLGGRDELGELVYTAVDVSMDVQASDTRAFDVNGDGLTDALTYSNQAPYGLRVILTGVDAEGRPFPKSSAIVSQLLHSYIATDLTGDGVPELVGFDGPVDAARYYIVQVNTPSTVGPSAFRSGLTITRDTGVHRAVWGHFDADGVADLVLVGNGVELLRGRGLGGTAEGVFQAPTRENWGEATPLIGEPVVVSTGDVNGDGFSDLVFLSASNGTLNLSWSIASASQGLPTGLFATPSYLAVGVVSYYSALVVGDFDRDGRDDAAFAYRNEADDPFLGVAFSRGATGFTEVDASYPVNPSAKKLMTTHMNSDASPDLVLQEPDAFGVRLFASDGDTVDRDDPFPNVSTLTTVSHLAELDLADLNWDGIDDLVMSRGGFIETRLGLAAGGFSGSGQSVQQFYNSVTVHDVTLDGVPDVLGHSSNSVFSAAEVFVSTASFGAPSGLLHDEPTTIQIGYAESVQPRDFNCDGVVDLTLFQNGNAVQLAAQARDALIPALRSVVTPYDLPAHSLVTHIGLTHVPPQAWHRANAHPCHGDVAWTTSLREVRDELGAPDRYRALASPWFSGYLEHYKRQVVGPEVRWLRQSRFAEDLDLATVDAPRALVFSIPVVAARQDDMTPANIRVFVQRLVLTSAADRPSDALYNEINAPDILPRVATDRGLVDVIERQLVWEEIDVDADLDLQTGFGRRFVYDAERGTVDILTDVGGLFVAIEALP